MARLEAFYAQPTGPDDRGPTTAQRMSQYALHAPALAHTAGSRALEDAAIAPADVTHLITASCTGFFAPGLDVALIKSLGLSTDVGRLHVGFMGCHAAFNAIAAARAISASDPDACVLVVCVELCSLHFSYGWDPGRLIANALFADGAAGAVVSQKEKLQQIQTVARPGARWSVQSLSSRLLPDSSQAMTWVIGDHGFEMTLASNVPTLIADHLGQWCQGWLGQAGLDIKSVGSWAVHPGGPKVLSAINDALSLPVDALTASRDVLARQGNMSSATILFILEEIRQNHKHQNKTDNTVACIGLGPGLMAEGMLLTPA
jgi:predicted naringenin-chalcone synthase